MIACGLSACGEPDVPPARVADGADASPAQAREVPACEELSRTGGDPAPAFRAEPVAEGLVLPWDLDFAPDGRILLTERPGRVRVIQDGILLEEPWAELDVYAEGEAGLLGIALAPDFETTGHVYVAGTFHLTGPGPDSASEWTGGTRSFLRQATTARTDLARRQEQGVELRVYRLTDREGRGEDQTLIADGMPAARLHVGAAIAFGPDSLLYVSTGDTLRPEQAQDTAGLGGRILRFTPGGGIPEDNPFDASPVFALGLQNVQGMDWHPETGDLFATDHGPSGLAAESNSAGKDELNRIVPRGNYGWPLEAGLSDEARFIAPLSEWTPAIALSGLAIYTGDEFPWFGNLFIGALRGEQLRRVALEEAPDLDSGWRLLCEEALFEGAFGRIRAVAMGRDGSLYFTTSNRERRGNAAPGDDRLLRIVPAGS